MCAMACGHGGMGAGLVRQQPDRNLLLRSGCLSINTANQYRRPMPSGNVVDQYRPSILGTKVVMEGKAVITARASRAAPISGKASLLICSMVRPLILAPT